MNNTKRSRYDLKILRVIICLVIVELSGFATCSALTISTTAKVNGEANKTIGSIVTTDGTNNDPMRGKFSLANDYKFLDEWFDFRWVQLLVSNKIDGVTQPADADGDYPQIDPPPNDGPTPYYYNATEWSTGMFGSDIIHVEKDFSMLVDAPGPNWPALTTLSFETYLVADDITAGIIGEKKLAVLAGFTWTHDAGATTGASDNTNTAGAAITINAAALGRIDTALGNATNGGNFTGWSAENASIHDFTNCPEPSTCFLVVFGMVSIASSTGTRKGC